jgi:uncharacterized membrane protein YqhA
VAIPSIHVLEAFMFLEKNPDAAKLSWMVGIFVVFVRLATDPGSAAMTSTGAERGSALKLLRDL